MVRLNYQVPKAGNVPVFHMKPDVPVAAAHVDELFHALVMKHGPWYIGDKRTAAPPRKTIRDEHDRAKLLHLNRFVAAVFMMRKDNKLKDDTTTLEIYQQSREMTRVGFRDGNQFNCTINNLLLGPHVLNSRISGDVVVEGLEGELPPPSLPVLDDERIAGTGVGVSSSTINSVRELLRRGGTE